MGATTGTCHVHRPLLRPFIARGFARVQTDMPASYHRSIHERLEALVRSGKDVENRVLWRLPELCEIFDHPSLRAALTELLGPDYVMNPHTYCHLSRPGSQGHGWHKDSYVRDHHLRHPRSRWVMALYSPQDQHEDFGPTAVIPEWYAHRVLTEEVGRSHAVPLVGQAGIVTLLHYDTWHGAAPNRTNENRFFLKFIFERRQEPRARAAAVAYPVWGQEERGMVPLLSMDVERWHEGAGPLPDAEMPKSDEVIAHFISQMDAGPETSRLSAAYVLACMGPGALRPLGDALSRQAEQWTATIQRRHASDPKGINPAVPPAAQALAAIGAGAVPALTAIAGDPRWYVRLLAADTLGNIGPAADAAIPALVRLSRDVHWWVRRNAVEALGRVGSAAAAVGACLAQRLADDDVRVRLNACIALDQIAAPVGTRDGLRAARERDDDVYVRYYADAALRRAGARREAAPTAPALDEAPVRSAWRAMLPFFDRATRDDLGL